MTEAVPRLSSITCAAGTAGRCLLLALLVVGSEAVSGAAELRFEVMPRWAGRPLVFDTLTHATAAGQTVSVTRLDFLLSKIALGNSDGTWVEATNAFAYINGREGRTRFELNALPAGRYTRVRFQVGVPARENHADPATFPPNHPLNPNLNGLHWSWQGGFVFLALEGAFALAPGRDGAAKQGGYSWHLATDALLMSVERPLALDLRDRGDVRVFLDVDELFAGSPPVRLADDTTSTHSRPGDPLAARLRASVERAFAVIAGAGQPTSVAVAPAAGRTVRIASNATPYRFTFPAHFPRPTLPMDNPLTEEGVALGRRLFHDPDLSINGSQSCASCHVAGQAFTDGRRYSVGAEGQVGTRSAMPLFNLAWKQAFFWDGRAPSLREQVLMPIENPIEMHESVTNVVAKLRHADASRAPAPLASRGSVEPDYPTLFARAFGSPEITADTLARALEQFLLTELAQDSKFDRSLNGQAALSAEEQRGLELFHTEYDPRRGQFGADCFHCHGGPLFQSQAFGNNGLDALFADPGRGTVTGREGDRGKFAVPSLRNVAVTAPYMHDGRFATLEEVVAHYATGVKRSPTLDPNLAKHPDGGVPLSAADQRALVAFLRTLTDDRYGQGATGRPVTVAK